MKTTIKKPDARSISPLSYSRNINTSKSTRPDIQKRSTQPDSFVERSYLLGFKPRDQPGNLRNTGSNNHARTLRRNDNSSHNRTVIYDRSRNSSYEEIVANISVQETALSKNVSYYDENAESSPNIQNTGNYNSNPDIHRKKSQGQNASFSILENNNENYSAANASFMSKRDLVLTKKDPKMLNLRSFLRGQNENTGMLSVQGANRKKGAPTYFPVITNTTALQKSKEEPKSEKILLIEKTYSTSPYKKKPLKNLGVLEAPNNDKLNDSLIQKKSNPQEHLYRIKGVGNVRSVDKPKLKSRFSQAQINYDGSKTEDPSPINNSKNSSFIILRRDNSSGLSSTKDNSSSNTGSQQHKITNSRDTSPTPSLYKYGNRKLSERTTGNYKSDRTGSITINKEQGSQGKLSLPRHLNKNAQKQSGAIDGTCLTEDQEAEYEARESESRKDIQSDYYTRVDTNSIQSASQCLKNEGFSSQANLSYVEKTPRKSEEGLRQYNSPQIVLQESPELKKRTLEQKFVDKSALARQSSNENVLDEFADGSMQVSVQDQNRSCSFSSICKPQYDELLETSLISYLNDKDQMRERTRKEIELTLSMTKHPVFRRSKVIVPKGLNSSDKEHSHTPSTNMTNSKSTNKNESLQLKQVREEFFQSEASIEKDRTLEIDFNFSEDIKATVGKSNILKDQVSPSFPGPINYRSSLIHKDLNIIREDPKRDSGTVNQESAIIDSSNLLDGLHEDPNITKNENDLLSPRTFLLANNKFESPQRVSNVLESGRVGQSFNENPMNSLNNENSFSHLDKGNSPFAERELSFKYSSEFSP